MILTIISVIQVIHVNRDAPPIITLLPKQMRTFLIDVEEGIELLSYPLIFLFLFFFYFWLTFCFQMSTIVRIIRVERLENVLTWNVPTRANVDLALNSILWQRHVFPPKLTVQIASSLCPPSSSWVSSPTSASCVHTVSAVSWERWLRQVEEVLEEEKCMEKLVVGGGVDSYGPIDECCKRSYLLFSPPQQNECESLLYLSYGYCELNLIICSWCSNPPIFFSSKQIYFFTQVSF